MFIYLIVNHITGRYYVGQHKGTNLKQYLQKKFYDASHGRGGSSRLYNSMRKHPKEAWSIHALLSDIQTRPELDRYERDFITFLRSQNPEYGYNICRGGEGFTGPHTDKTRQKIVEASKQMWADRGIAEREIIISNMHKYGHSLEGKKRVREANAQRTGSKVSAQTIQKLRDSHIGLASSRRKLVRCIETNEIFPSLTLAVERF